MLDRCTRDTVMAINELAGFRDVNAVPTRIFNRAQEDSAPNSCGTCLRGSRGASV